MARLINTFLPAIPHSGGGEYDLCCVSLIHSHVRGGLGFKSVLRSPCHPLSNLLTRSAIPYHDVNGKVDQDRKWRSAHWGTMIRG